MSTRRGDYPGRVFFNHYSECSNLQIVGRPITKGRLFLTVAFKFLYFLLFGFAYKSCSFLPGFDTYEAYIH